MKYDPRDPDSRAHPVHDDIRGNLEQKISQEENPGAESESGLREPEIRIHGELGEADVHAVEIIDEIA
jgi:hypothetical protein